MSNSPTPLDRRYILLQQKAERDDRLQSVVPIHPSILDLPEDILFDVGIAKDSLYAARQQFEKETNDYTDWMKKERYQYYSELKLREYEHFNDNWSFEFAPHDGILKMTWKADDKEPIHIALVNNVLITNALEFEKGKGLIKPEDCEIVENVAYLQGSVHYSDGILLSPETMLEYEAKSPLGEIARDQEDWKLDIPMNAFCSTYLDNIPQGLLLRDWAVDYNNRLLQKANPPTIH